MNIKKYNKLRFYMSETSVMDFSDISSITKTAGSESYIVNCKNGQKIEYRSVNILQRYKEFIQYIIDNSDNDDDK